MYIFTKPKYVWNINDVLQSLPLQPCVFVFDLSWQLYTQLIHQQITSCIIPPMFTQPGLCTSHNHKQPTHCFIWAFRISRSVIAVLYTGLYSVFTVKFTIKDFLLILTSLLTVDPANHAWDHFLTVPSPDLLSCQQVCYLILAPAELVFSNTMCGHLNCSYLNNDKG